jgi:hypothetical protein
MNEFDRQRHLLEEHEDSVRKKYRIEPAQPVPYRCFGCGTPVDGLLVLHQRMYCDRCLIEESLVDG